MFSSYDKRNSDKSRFYPGPWSIILTKLGFSSYTPSYSHYETYYNRIIFAFLAHLTQKELQIPSSI